MTAIATDPRRIRVLLVEDAESDALLVLRALEQGGYALEHRRVDAALDFQQALAEEAWDLILSDYSMPGFDGLRAYALLSETDLDVPFILVSGRVGEERAIAAMRLGVADYVHKDQLERLVPAVKRTLADAELRRENRSYAAALAASEERLRRLTQNAPDIIFEYRLLPRPQFSFVSPAVYGITGYIPAEHENNPDLWLQLTHEEDRETLSRLLTGKADPSASHLVRWQHPDGTWRWVDIRATPLHERSAVVGVEGIVRDVTHHKELEAQYAAAQRMEAIGRLAGGIAHDFNNMLTVIGSYCSLLRHELREHDKGLSRVEKIQSATQRAADLVQQLLAFSRRQPRRVRPVNLAVIVRNLTPMLDRLIGEDVQFHLLAPEDLRSVHADRAQIEQVLMNLVVNARDAMPAGGRLTLELENVPLDKLVGVEGVTPKPGRYVRLAVSDTGTGMDEITRTHLFDPFYTTKPVGKGTGLGLSTVYGIVKQMEGYIWVYSELEHGTTFKIYFPASDAAPSREEPAKPATIARGHETILLVEDEELVRDATREILQAQGYTILPAANGKAALEMLAGYERQIDLLLTDVVMPEMNGVELAARLREVRPDLKVLYTTGYTDVSTVGSAAAEDHAPVLQKPFGSDALLVSVRDVLMRAERD